MRLFQSKYAKLKEDVIKSILTYNKGLDKKKLQKKEVNSLINLCHPSDREAFEDRYNDL